MSCVHRRLVGHVHGAPVGLVAGRLQLGCRRCHARCVAVGEHDARALLAEAARRRCADASRRAGHDRAPAGEVCGHGVSLSARRGFNRLRRTWTASTTWAGCTGFGPVVEPGGELVYHERWEPRVFAIQMLVGLEGLGARAGRTGDARGDGSGRLPGRLLLRAMAVQRRATPGAQGHDRARRGRADDGAARGR